MNINRRPGGGELLEAAAPMKVHEVFWPAPLLSRRPPSSRCWPVQKRPGRPGEAGSVPGRGSPMLSLCWGEIPTFCGIDSGQIPRARPGRPPGGGPEPPGTGAAPFSWQTHVELSSAAGVVRRACASASQLWWTGLHWSQLGGLVQTDFLKQTLLFVERVAMPPGSEDQGDSVPVCLWGRPLAERLLTCGGPVPGAGHGAEAAGMAVGTWAWQR